MIVLSILVAVLLAGMIFLTWSSDAIADRCAELEKRTFSVEGIQQAHHDWILEQQKAQDAKDEEEQFAALDALLRGRP
jgi:hypothetical protein